VSKIKRSDLNEIQSLNQQLADLEAQYLTLREYKETVAFAVDYGPSLKPDHVKKPHFPLEIPQGSVAYGLVVQGFCEAVAVRISTVVYALQKLNVDIDYDALMRGLKSDIAPPTSADD
jgi:hypothetical protein